MFGHFSFFPSNKHSTKTLQSKQHGKNSRRFGESRESTRPNKEAGTNGEEESAHWTCQEENVVQQALRQQGRGPRSGTRTKQHGFSNGRSKQQVKGEMVSPTQNALS